MPTPLVVKDVAHARPTPLGVKDVAHAMPSSLAVKEMALAMPNSLAMKEMALAMPSSLDVKEVADAMTTFLVVKEVAPVKPCAVKDVADEVLDEEPQHQKIFYMSLLRKSLVASHQNASTMRGALAVG
jgi:hypothetical protein